METTGILKSASEQQLDFMKLLVTQLQNQNPLEPMNNNEMASQLSQFTQLQQLEEMNSSFSQVLDTMQRDYANSLIGQQVSFLDSSDSSTLITGVVEQTLNSGGGNITLSVGGSSISLDDILTVGGTGD
jgi:flagellar basal-body rod modification protein FlgD